MGCTKKRYSGHELNLQDILDCLYRNERHWKSNRALNYSVRRVQTQTVVLKDEEIQNNKAEPKMKRRAASGQQLQMFLLHFFIKKQISYC